MRHTKQWFIKRIGKHIYRKGGTCRCRHCKNVLEFGLDIMDNTHADYLYCCQNEMGLKYSDKPLTTKESKR